MRFPPPQDCTERRFVRAMSVKPFGLNQGIRPVDVDASEMGVSA